MRERESKREQEREREREQEREREREIYIYIYRERERKKKKERKTLDDRVEERWRANVTLCLVALQLNVSRVTNHAMLRAAQSRRVDVLLRIIMAND